MIGSAARTTMTSEVLLVPPGPVVVKVTIFVLFGFV